MTTYYFPKYWNLDTCAEWLFSRQPEFKFYWSDYRWHRRCSKKNPNAGQHLLTVA